MNHSNNIVIIIPGNFKCITIMNCCVLSIIIMITIHNYYCLLYKWFTNGYTSLHYCIVIIVYILSNISVMEFEMFVGKVTHITSQYGK